MTNKNVANDPQTNRNALLLFIPEEKPGPKSEKNVIYITPFKKEGNSQRNLKVKKELQKIIFEKK